MTLAQKMENTLPQLALQLVLERRLEDVGGSIVYSVEEPWHKAELPLHPAVTVVADAAAFEAAMEEPQQKILYVPASAMLTQSHACTILQRQALPKTILWESVA